MPKGTEMLGTSKSALAMGTLTAMNMKVVIKTIGATAVEEMGEAHGTAAMLDLVRHILSATGQFRYSGFVASRADIIYDSTTAPISTVTVTIGDGGFGSATVTETATLFSTTSDCTATTTDLTTVTEDGSTITETTTATGPTVTDTITEGASTVTEPGSTKTETVTDTVTNTETTTYTHNQFTTQTETTTETQTLEVTTTVTASDCSETGGGNSLDYGTCSDPSIKWADGLDGRTGYSFTTNNQEDFPFGSDTSIGSVTGLVCNRLQSPCNAPQATLDRCAEAANAANGLSGQEAADVWNEMMT
jgi:hypothetical protein